MSKVLVLGAGKIGVAVAENMARSRDYAVTLADVRMAAVETSPPGAVERKVIDVTDEAPLKAALGQTDVVISALPFFLNPMVAQAARQVGVHYFDLTEDVATARAVRATAQGADTAFVSQCGLAPGFIAIVANHLVGRFDEVEDVRLRVGALPQFPDNTLKYNLTWSTDGLINEYCNACDAIHEGERRELLPLEGLEHFSFDGVDYEAFSTSGGVGTLCETLEGRVRNLSYKTIRYPGHRDHVWMLVRDLKLCEHRDTFKSLIEYGIPTTRQDVVLIFVTVTGMRRDLFTQETYARRIYGDVEDGGQSAIQKTTAAGVCAMVDLHRQGRLPRKGFIRQEDAPFAELIANPFGGVYA